MCLQERQYAMCDASLPCIFTVDEILATGRAAAAGLAHLHNEHRLLHGDMKSANILVSRDLSTIKVRVESETSVI